MSENDLEQATPVVEGSALDRAAATGALHRPSDPVADPEDAGDGVPRNPPGWAGFDARG